MKQSSAANPHRDPGDIGTAAAAAVTSTTAPRSAEFGQEEFQTPISTPRGIFNGRREDATLESTESSVTVRTPPQTITSQSHVQVAVTLPSTHADSRKSLDSYKSAREEDDRCLLPQHPPLETIAASHAISFESITGAVGPADPAIFAAASTSPRAPPVTARNSIVNIGLDASFPMFTPNIITATPTTSAPNIRTPSRQPSIPELPALTSIGAQKPGSLPTDVAMGTQPSANKNAPGNRPVAPDTVSSDRMPRRAPPVKSFALSPLSPLNPASRSAGKSTSPTSPIVGGVIASRSLASPTPTAAKPSLLDKPLSGDQQTKAWHYAVLSSPQHWFWNFYDVLIRGIDFFHILALPIMLAFICDFGIRLVPCFVVCDLVLCASIAIDIRRPRKDRFGQLLIKPQEIRQLHLSKIATKFEFLALIPLDWAVLSYAISSDAQLTCSNPVYVYSNGTIQSRVPIPDMPVTELRHMYNANDMPWLLELYCISRLIRLLRLFRTIKWGIDLSIPGLVDPISRLAKTLALTVLFSHVNSCMFWVLSIRIPEEDRWIDKFHILEDRQGLVRSVYARYLRNVSSAEKALFFLPREVENDAEILYQFFEMLCAAVLYGSIFGNMSSIVRALDSQAGLDKASKLRKFKKANLEGYMKKFKFPPELQTKVLQQEEFDWAHKKGVDTDDLFMNLPLTIREQVNYHMYYDLISSVPIFKEHANEVIKRALCQKISIINITPNFYICKAGERGTEMYFVRDGDVEVMPPDESKVFVTLGPGAFFGEVALFSNNLRTATVKSKTEVQLCVLKKKEFDEILTQYSGLVDVFKEQIEKRYAADRARIAAQAEEELRKRRASLESAAQGALGFNRLTTAISGTMARVRESVERSRHGLAHSDQSRSASMDHVSHSGSVGCPKLDPLPARLKLHPSPELVRDRPRHVEEP